MENQGLFEAIGFAGRAHLGQLRKDGKTPYVSHVFRVAMTLSQLFGVKEEEILTAAVLHDTIEDTTTDFDDIEERFGLRVAEWVALLSKDMRMPHGKREDAYLRQLAQAPYEVKLIKLADMYDNLLDSQFCAEGNPAHTLRKTEHIVQLFSKRPHSRLKKPLLIVHALIKKLNSEK